MKARPSHYARAFLACLAAGVSYESATPRLRAMLAKRGDTHRLPQVVEEIEKAEVARRGGHRVRVEFARVASPAHERKMLKEFSKADRVSATINPELIAGTRITFDEERELDVSLAGKMRALFHP